MSDVTLTINNRTYRVACEAGQESEVHDLGAQVSQRVEQLVRSFGQIGESRLLLMTGLMFADELESANRKLANLQSDSSTVGQALQQEEQLAQTVTAMAERIESIAAKLVTAAEKSESVSPKPSKSAQGS